MSDSEKLRKAIEMLNVSVPVLSIGSISIPIYNAIMLIDDVCKNLEKNEKKEEKDGIVEDTSEERT